MPWLQPAPGSVQSWYYHRTTLGNWHLAKCLIFLLCVLRIESVRGWSVIAAIANAVAWCCCTWATPAARSHEALQTVCFIVSMVSFTARAMVSGLAALASQLVSRMHMGCLLSD
jgi:hypothetical protein